MRDTLRDGLQEACLRLVFAELGERAVAVVDERAQLRIGPPLEHRGHDPLGAPRLGQVVVKDDDLDGATSPAESGPCRPFEAGSSRRPTATSWRRRGSQWSPSRRAGCATTLGPARGLSSLA